MTSDRDSGWGELGFDTRLSIFRPCIEEATGGAALCVYEGDYTNDGTVDGNDFLH